MTLEGWGRHSVDASEVTPNSLYAEAATRANLARGLGRSYGDSSLPPTGTVALNTRRADRILSFDPAQKLVTGEAGCSIEALNRVFIKQGYFVPVTPGTKYVTCGGALAADVHGKDQHSAGNFGHHVRCITMRTADGETRVVSPDSHPKLFFATMGGMGLTGHILDMTFEMRAIPSPWISQYTRRIPNLDAFLEALETSAPQWPYTVGWIDCVTRGAAMGRGILICGRWAAEHEAPNRPPRDLPRPRLPFDFPDALLGTATMKAANTLYYHKHVAREASGVVSPEPFFYPLDVVRDWNRGYGRRGFTQYQCVLPRAHAAKSCRRVLAELTRRGGASFLAVIKDFGRDSIGTLSFPTPGFTLALDIPMRDETQALVDALNDVVAEEGGRIYLAKDSLTRPEHFQAMEGERLRTFNAVRDEWDPNRRFRSMQSIRLMGDEL